MQNQTNPKPSGAPMAKLVLVAAMIISLGAVAGIIGYVLTRQKSIITPTVPPPKTISAIEISSDKKSILNVDTKEVIFMIDDANKYLKDSGYAYDSDTFQDTNAKYAGDCFLDAALSNKKDRIIFSTSCLEGDLQEAWIGIYEFCDTEEYELWKCYRNFRAIKIFINKSGKNFVWSFDGKTISYEADLGLSGMTETRTIDAGTGDILERKLDIKTGRGELDDGIDIAQLQAEIDSGDQTWKKLYEGPCHGDCGQTEFSKLVRLNPDLILLNLKSYGFNDDDIKNAKEVSSESGKKVYEIQHKTNYYFVTLSQPVIGLLKVWIISEIELKEKVCQPKLIGIKLKSKSDGANQIFEEENNKLNHITSAEQFTEKEYKMYCVNWHYLDELPNEILNKLPESDFADSLKSIDTKNWSLYQNGEIKLSFSHPAEWNVKKGTMWGDKWAEPFYYLGSFVAGPLIVNTGRRSGMWGIDNLGSITINGRKTFMLKSSLSDGYISYYTKIYISDDRYLYIEYKPKYNFQDDNKENESIFRSILLTLKPYEYSEEKDTAQWPSFRSEKDGFEIKYPDNIIQSGHVIIDGSYQYIWVKTGSLNPFITITSKYIEGLSLEEWLKENKVKTDYGKENIVLENATFIKYYDADKGFYNFYTTQNNKIFIITLYERDDMIKKILSTFKFTKN